MDLAKKQAQTCDTNNPDDDDFVQILQVVPSPKPKVEKNSVEDDVVQILEELPPIPLRDHPVIDLDT